MRSTKRSKTLLTCFAAGLISITSAAGAATLDGLRKDGFVRGANANEVPYAYMDADGKAKGIGPDVAAAVWEKLGVKDVAWSVTPFGTLIPGLKARRYDFVGAEMAILPDRCKQVAFTEPNSSYGEGLLVPKGNPKNLHGYDDIKKNPALKVAIVSGADQIDFLHEMGVPDGQIVMLQANADALSAVRTGRADAYAATELTVAELAHGAGDAGVEQAQPFHDPVIKGKPARSYGAFDFRPEDKELYAAFNEALIAFKKTEQYATILGKYGLSADSIAAARDHKMADLCAGK